MKNLNKEVGSYCEKIARTYLKKNDYNILECNFKNFLGEIDIICQKDGLIIIIEVKGRYNYDYGLPQESVNLSKQKSIIKVASSYITYNKIVNTNFRFDVIEIYLNNKNNLFKINHIKDAFRL
ncbi:YraN family protein [Clostridium saccharobutylicum]|uniref:UPF0102 protein CLSA_c14050 n=1 Tax=Clostridium saccharobutylicum DSM 13864 TaxID=1345695 RepID=U5MPJ6_CLOSA|nr:YraN family protein [Clostridium saccharobutylicum]AGX42408.1 endonuclease [Clostridium saccharobutylicum DSM 13864]AQR89690.1 hypothetical protein CLOSC_13930 [Clostridium saccharobutylicum]AQR99592.1 hypothetical protein CSACC_14010 [Clostridium saccharobutylicum]AQS09322.1 hypothetical protein CLOBY_14490 [Clostridium saccharobutylicum]AQS13578.1 hypothetical protein CLOSACC_14010 [Clostridium saccharobutylicum]